MVVPENKQKQKLFQRKQSFYGTVNHGFMDTEKKKQISFNFPSKVKS